MEITEFIVAITGVIAILVSLLTALTSAKQSAFNNLKHVVDELEKELDRERKERKKLEQWQDSAEITMRNLEHDLRLWRNYAARLIRQLHEVAPDTTPVPLDTEPIIKAIRHDSDQSSRSL